MAFHKLREEAHGHREKAIERARGGRMEHDDAPQDRKLFREEIHKVGKRLETMKKGGEVEGKKPARRLDRPHRRADGGKVEAAEHRARGGKAGKHHPQVNIMIAQPPQDRPVPVPVRQPVPVPVPAGAGPAMPPGGMPPHPPVAGMGGMPPGAMPPRKRGGKVMDMDGGAMSGEGRLEKAEMVERRRK